VTPEVAVVIPSFRRPDGLDRVLASLAEQADLAALAAEVVVVDNAPEGPAAETAARWRARLPAPLRYVHAPRPGVATARNAGLAEVRAPHVAFLDDDQRAPRGWLAALYAAHVALEADVTFGPVHGRAPDAPEALRPLLERFFSREDRGATGLLSDARGCGCGNSLLRRATALAGASPFDVAADQSGGEDDRLFARLAAEGARFAWCAEAGVEEIAPAERSTLAYALRRNFAYGQGPTRQRLRRSDAVGAAGWMAVGAAQAAAHGAGALMLRALGRPGWRARAVAAAGGLGKLFPGARVDFYGRAAAEPRSARAAAAAASSVV
jgi:succinoglycan biosynthesis protein ExoM